MGTQFKNEGWEIDLDKFLTMKEISGLTSFVKKQRLNFEAKREVWVEWILVELGINTGLRVAEIADLQCGDICIRDELSYIAVRNGKGGRSRNVRINKDFQKTILKYMKWKEQEGEAVSQNSYVLVSPKTGSKYSRRGLQLAFKRCIRKADIPQYHSIHHLRHTYASLLLKSSNNNLRLVQKQLGHASLLTTQVYIDTFTDDINKAIEGILN